MTAAAGTLAAATCARAEAEAAETLKSVAASRGLLYGSCLAGRRFRTDKAYADLMARECSILTPENALKWVSLEKRPGEYDFTDADDAMAFAQEHGIKMRGHTLVWGQSTPPWYAAGLDPAVLRRVLLKHIETIVRRYAGKIFEWDVVNESIAPPHRRPDGLRNNVYLAAFGPDYMVDYFAVVRALDPAARLVYNDFGFEHQDQFSQARNSALLRFLETALSRGAPITGVGLQTHLRVGQSFNARAYGELLDSIAALGLQISITELDVDDRSAPADFSERDQAVYRLVREVMDIALPRKKVTQVVTWGLTGRYSYRNNPGERRPDGLSTRGVPFDDELAVTGVFRALRDSMAAAPRRDGA